jgi:hypothetical protein
MPYPAGSRSERRAAIASVRPYSRVVDPNFMRSPQRHCSRSAEPHQCRGSCSGWQRLRPQEVRGGVDCPQPHWNAAPREVDMLTPDNDGPRFSLDIEIVDSAAQIAQAVAARPPGQVVRLTATEITAATGRRAWLPASAGPRTAQLGTSLLMSESPRFEGNEPANGADLVMAARGQTGRELIIGDREQILTPAPFRDSAVGTSPAGVVRARTITSGGIRIPVVGIPQLPLDTDYIMTHSMHEMFTDGSPYQTARMAPRSLLHLDPPIGSDAKSWRPLHPSFRAGPVALSPDGSTAAVLEFRMSSGPHAACAIALVDTGTGDSKTVGDLPDHPNYDLGSLSFSPDSRYLMVTSPMPATTLIFDLTRDEMLQPDETWEAAAFCPGGMYVVARLTGAAVLISHFDAATGQLTPKMEIREQSEETALLLSGITTDLTGRRVAGITTIGVSPEFRYERGWGWRPIVLDLEDGWAELALKPMMTSGHERDVQSVAWADPWAGSAYPTLSDGFTKQSIPTPSTLSADASLEISSGWYDASQFALFAAGGGAGPSLPQIIGAILVLLAGVTAEDPETGRELAEQLGGLFNAGAANASQPRALWLQGPSMAARVANGQSVSTVLASAL